MTDRAKSPETLQEITRDTDTRDELAHAKRQAAEKGFDNMLIVDVDAHVTETAYWSEILDYMPSDVYQQMGRSFLDKNGNGPPGLLNSQPGLTYQNMFGRIPHQQLTSESTEDTPVHRQTQLVQRAMDSMAIDYMVCFPTPMLVLGMHPQPEVEVQLAWAFNRWLTEKVLSQDKRLMGLLYLPFNSPEECPKMIEAFADKPGVCGFTCTSVRMQPVHHNRFMRTYAMLEERGLPMTFHAAFNWADGSMGQLNRFLSMHAISFVHCNIIHLTNWVINGIPERFPKLKVMWIESGLAWLPYMMQRLDQEYMMRSSEAPLLRKRPSEYIREMYFSSQPLETLHPKLTEATFEAINAETQLCWCSD